MVDGGSSFVGKSPRFKVWPRFVVPKGDTIGNISQKEISAYSK
jgi:hypothetical protein